MTQLAIKLQLRLSLVCIEIKNQIWLPWQNIGSNMSNILCIYWDHLGEKGRKWKCYLTRANFDGALAFSMPSEIWQLVRAATWSTTWPTPEPRSMNLFSSEIGWSLSTIWQINSKLVSPYTWKSDGQMS